MEEPSSMDDDYGSSMDAKIIVGVDFGTTYSALAYVKTTDPRDLFLIEEWGQGSPSARKVPTVLKYRNDNQSSTFSWGFQAANMEGVRKHEWFKLDLYPHLDRSELASEYPSDTALPSLSGAACERLVTHYLESLRKCVDLYFRSHGVDRHGADPMPRQYVITVPAIWPDRAKNTTRRCAENAGMGQDIVIISEPEAAAIYALEKERATGLVAGKTFVLCDAGGGTVDLISYTVASRVPPQVYESASGSGDLCGSAFLNRIFAKHLRDKFRRNDDWIGGWDDDFQDEALRKFERFKETFMGEDDEDFALRVRLPDKPNLGIRGGYLRIRGSVLRDRIFKPVIERVQRLVKAQIAKTPNPVEAVLLAGGFGESHYLEKSLKETVAGLRSDKRIDVRKTENSATAIVRGALIRGLFKEMPEIPIYVPAARRARRHYGTLCWFRFNPEEHPEEKKHLDKDTGEARIKLMHWFVKKNELIEEQKPKPFPFSVQQRLESGPLRPANIDIYVCDTPDDQQPPDDDMDPGVVKSMALTVDLADVPKDHEAVITRRVNKRDVASVSFQVEMTLYSAELQFRLVVPGMKPKEAEIIFED